MDNHRDFTCKLESSRPLAKETGILLANCTVAHVAYATQDFHCAQGGRMCYEASRMPMQPDRFSESQSVSTQPQGGRQLISSRLAKSGAGCLVTSTASGGGVIYERIYVGPNLERKIAQFEQKDEEPRTLLQKMQQSNLGSAQSIAEHPLAKINRHFDGDNIRLDDQQTIIKDQP